MKIRAAIEEAIRSKKEIRIVDVAKASGVSRQFVHTVLHDYVKHGRLVHIGRANRSRYVSADAHTLLRAKKGELSYRSSMMNRGVEEDRVLSVIRAQTGILLDLPEHIERIVSYAFTEMLNNAIEHSRSERIAVTMTRSETGIDFSVTDHGIGVYRSIMEKNRLSNELEAVQDLLKGKQTTMPERHSGEGIFFTSKVADRFSIKSSSKHVLFDTIAEDIFVSDSKHRMGTRVEFWIGLTSRHTLADTFKRYAGNAFAFDTTEVTVELYTIDSDFISRSQARRILSGLEAFSTVVLDFRNVLSAGQSFTDEIFRVWKRNHPGIAIEVKNANENVDLMIKRSMAP